MTSNLPTPPAGWEWKKLDDIKISNIIGLVRNTSEQKYSNTYKYIKMNNISNDNKFDPENIVYIDASFDEVEKFSLKKGDFLFNTRNSIALVGKSCIFNSNESDILFNNNIMRIRFNNNISPYFIAYQFNSSVIKKQLHPMKSGTTNVAAIYYKTLKELKILLPPLDEQKRLVSLLDTLFAKIDRSIELLEENITAADALLPSALNTVFGELTEYKKKNLKDITSKIGSGATPSGGGKAYKETGISLIRSMNVHDYGFRDKNLALIDDQQAQKLNNVTVQENDVLLNITGASVARCCIVDSQYLPARVNQHVAIIRLNEGILPQYVHYYLISPNTKNDLLFNAGGGATREAITKKMIEEFEIPLPLLDIQTQTVEYLDSIRTKVEILKRVQNDKIKNLKALKASILDRAFKGEL